MTCLFPIRMAHFKCAPLFRLFGILIAFFLCCSPALAVGYLYLDTGAQPELSAHSVGETRYNPGDSFNISIILTNKGRDTAMQIQPMQVPGAYDPSTALGVTVRPFVLGAPITIKTPPTVLGDIGSWDQVPLQIKGTVHEDAIPGIYTIPLDVSYNYVYAIPFLGEDVTTIQLLYREKRQTLPVTFRVVSEVRPAVINERSDNLMPGTQGYLVVDVVNNGYETGNEVTLSILPSDNVTFQMVDSSVYLGRFPPGNITTIKTRIAVKEETGAGSYPAVLKGIYRDKEGIFQSTQDVPLAITVSKGPKFEILTDNIVINPGGTETITVSYRNTGDAPAYNAQARIIGNQVIEPVMGTASLGILGVGENKSAQFTISAKSAIVGKNYVVDTDVKFRDRLDALMLSDKMSFGVDVEDPTGLKALTSNPVILIIIIGALVILIYAVLKLRKKK